LVHGRQDRDRSDDHTHLEARRDQQGIRSDARRRIDSRGGGLLSPAGNSAARRNRALTQGPVLPALLQLAAPNFLLAALQAGATFADAYFVGRLGTAPLAGLALVFPLIALMQMMSAGAIGGGVSSAIARAVGANDLARAGATALQAVYVAAVCGITFTVVMLLAGRALYRALGAAGAALAAALDYSHVIFGGALLVWFANFAANVLRGSGDMRTPSAVLGCTALLQVVLAGVLTTDAGPLPRLGIEGVAFAYLTGFGVAAVVLGGCVCRQLHIWGVRLHLPPPDRGRIGEILRVGLISSFNAVQTVVTALILTGFVGAYGMAGLAGYGVGTRLELLQVPFVFAIGAALVAMVGINVGAGDLARARRVAWVGGAVGAALTGSVGLIVALRPDWWAGMFSSDPAVLASAYAYLQVVGPCYVFLGLGIALYFASQGRGRMLGPVLASSARLLIAILGGYAVVAHSSTLDALFVVIAIAMTAYGVGSALAVARSVFR
jgi:putative MATE family efflux protein